MADHKILNKPTTHIIGIACRTSNHPDEGPKDIPKLWERFATEDIPSRIPNKVSNEVIALYCEYDGDHTKPYTLIIGCPVSSIGTIPDGLVGKTIPESAYALFQAKGDFPDSLINTWEQIWENSSLDRTYVGDFELYSEDFFTSPQKEVEVFIGITNGANS